MKLIVTHHNPDLDAVGSVWLLKKFDAQKFGKAQLAFVDPGKTISPDTLAKSNLDPNEVTHVDTGLGEFDHHQPDRAGNKTISATSLVYDYICQRYPDQANDEALQTLVEIITEIDHFGELFWPEAAHSRYSLMTHHLLHGLEHLQGYEDDDMIEFGMTCLDSSYQILKNQLKAAELLKTRAQYFEHPFGTVMLIATKNDDVLKLGQKQGVTMTIRKDEEDGHVRIKLRPDATIDLKPLADKIMAMEPEASWFYHHSGKMLLNGSVKQHNKVPSQLNLLQIHTLVKECYG